MRKMLRLAAVAVALASTGMASSAYAAGATATASAEILTSLTVTKNADLSFGQIAVNSDGTVVLASDGTTRTCSSGLVCAGAPALSKFTVTGTSGVGISATVDQTSIQLTHAVDTTKKFTLTMDAPNFPAGSTLTSGSAVFNVGGSLAVVAANAIPGVYSGTFNVTVTY